MAGNIDDRLAVGSASNLVAQQLGIDLTPPGEWTVEQRVSFVRNLSGVIVQYPANFSDTTISNAQTILGQTNLAAIPVDDSSSAGVFFTQLADTSIDVGSKLANVGTAALNIVSNVAQSTENLSSGLKTGTQTFSFGPVAIVATLAVVALLVLNTSKRVQSAVDF